MALDPDTFDALIGTIRRFVAERLRPLEERVAEEDEVPGDVVREMREMGLFGLSIPEEFGGLGLTMSEEVRVALVFGRTTPAFRSVFGTNVGIGSQGLVMAGSDEQKAEWLPRIASGEKKPFAFDCSSWRACQPREPSANGATVASRRSINLGSGSLRLAGGGKYERATEKYGARSQTSRCYAL